MFDRTRWSAIGAAVAVTLAGGVSIRSADATISSGERDVFVPITPCRLVDTRPAPLTVGDRAAALTAGETYSMNVTGSHGNCTIPSDATAVAFNVTVVNGTVDSYLTLWPSDAARPIASNLNWSAGSGPIPNKVDVKLAADGRVSMFNNGGTVDVLADVVGYYAHHNHDDRYYTKAEIDSADHVASLRTDTYSHWAVQNFNPGAQPQLLPIGGACMTNTQPLPVTFMVPLTLSVGSRIISVDVTTYDGYGPPMLLELHRTTLNTTGSSEIAIASGGGSDGPTAVDHDSLVPSGPEIVGADETYAVQLTNMNAGNGFCGLTVSYDLDN